MVNEEFNQRITVFGISLVVGIANALDYAGSVDPQVAKTSKEITARLGVAFYTTLLVLIQSAVLVFALHIAQGREEMALNQSGQSRLDKLIKRREKK